jgi:hypothetical protein
MSFSLLDARAADLDARGEHGGKLVFALKFYKRLICAPVINVPDGYRIALPAEGRALLPPASEAQLPCADALPSGVRSRPA